MSHADVISAVTPNSSSSAHTSASGSRSMTAAWISNGRRSVPYSRR